jgi:DNA-binding NarL/FixJ family response regulator
MQARTDVLIADDEPDVVASVRDALEKSPRLRVVAEAVDGDVAWERIRLLRPHIAIIDIGMPGIDGIALTRKLREHGLPTEVILLTVCDERSMFDTALELGVKGYLLKHYTGTEIRTCVEAVADGQHCASPPVVSHIINKSRLAAQSAADAALDTLTLQEAAIYRRIRQHKSSKEIATDLGISVRTVDTHRSNICRKLGLHGNYGLHKYVGRDRHET